MFLCFAFLLLFNTPQEAPRDPKTVAASDYDLAMPLPLDKAVTVGKLENGLTYYVRQHAKPENRLELRLVVNAGSVQEDEDQLGLAHFLEHMAFNGTKNFEKQALVDYIESIGMNFGADLNAGTSFDETIYILEVPTDDEEILAKAFLILSDWAQNISLDEEEVEKERGVVLEEWRRGLGAQSRIRDKQFPVMFKDSRYADRLPIGTKEIIQTAPASALQRFYKDWYRPDMMAVIAVGDYDEVKLEAMIRKNFGDIPAATNPRPRVNGTVPDHEETLFSMVADPENTMSMIQVVDKREPEQTITVADLRKSLVRAIGQNILNQRLRELTREAEPPFINAFAGSTSMVRAKDAFMIGAIVREGEFDKGLASVLTEIERAERFGFTESELSRTKTRFKRGAERSFLEEGKVQSARFVGSYVGHFLQGARFMSAESRLALSKQLMPGITLDEVNQEMRNLMDPGNQVVTVTAPEKEGLELPKESMLAEVIDKVKSTELKAYEDEVGDQPLVANKPKAGKIVKEHVRDDLGVTEWTLSNGARVVFKVTDFKNDEVRMRASSDGGISLIDAKDYIPATSAALLVGESGFGAFNAIQLEKKLAGKIASVNPFIGTLSEGMSGFSSPQDMETFFQLVYLAFTSPRMEDKAVASIQSRWKTMIENRLSSPEQVFSDAIRKKKYGDHPLEQPLTIADLDKLNPAKSLKIYKDRFAGVGDFTFVFIGNIDTDSFRPLVETYLGGLPSGRLEESWKDPEVKAIEGQHDLVVEKGLEPKTTVYMNYYGPAEWNSENRYTFNSMNAVLRIILREVLREDMGGVYGVRLSGGLSRDPKHAFSNTIRFTCDPEKADALVAAVHEEVAKIQNDGVPEKYLAKVKENQNRSYELGLKQNGFWMSNLLFCYTNDIDPTSVLNYPERVEKLTSAAVQDAAKKYFSKENFLFARLVPEKSATDAE